MTTANNTKYFDKYYVGLRKKDKKASGKQLAFAVPDGTDSAAKKRKQTVDSWVAGSWYRDDKAPEAGTVFDNKPMTGFQLTEWSGRYITDNKVARVLDPRGFELEIYIPNLMDLILNTVIDHGLIKDELVWLREGGNNRLVRTADPLYAEAIKNTEAAGQKKGKPALGHEVGDIISNTLGTYLYMGLMDVEFVIPRGKRVEDDEITEQYGTTYDGGWFLGMERGPRRKRIYQQYYMLEDDVLASVNVGRRHVYKEVSLGRHHVDEGLFFRKSKMATLKVESSGNPIPKVGEDVYFEVSYDSAVYYDVDGNVVSEKEFIEKQKKADNAYDYTKPRTQLEGNTYWKTYVARVNDGPLQTSPVKGKFLDRAIRGYRR